jgi:hypothetical protein
VAQREHPYQEHARITEGILYRRIFNDPDYFVPDEPDAAGQPGRPSSFAFLPDGNEPYTSMYLKNIVSEDEMLKDCPNTCPGCGLCEIDARMLTGLGINATYEPEWGIGHVGVWGLDSTKPGGRLRRKVAHRSLVIVRPAHYR